MQCFIELNIIHHMLPRGFYFHHFQNQQFYQLMEWVTSRARLRSRVRNRLARVESCLFPTFNRFLYSAITMYLGFPYYGDEYKVMGLAPYGEPEFADFFRKLIRPKDDVFELNLDYFTHHHKGVKMSWNGGAPIVQPFYSKLLERELGPARKKGKESSTRDENIAKSLQVVTEEIIIHLLNRMHKKVGSKISLYDRWSCDELSS